MIDNTAWCNTVEGIHIKAKELNLKAYSLGCSCYNCNKEFNQVLEELKMIDGSYCRAFTTVWTAPGVCNCNASDRNISVFEREVWNTAIETVIKTLINKTHVSNEVKIIIRSLKK